IQRIVDAIHAEEVGGTQNEPRKFPPIQNRLRFWCESQLCLLSGKPDIFSRRVQEDRPAPVFRSDSPLIKIISGEEPGGDSIIRDAASGLSSSLAEFKLISVIVQESGKETSADTFVVGTIPPRDLDQSKQQPPFSRQVGHERSAVSRRRASGFRAQSEAVRHHSDLLMAIWDPDAESKTAGTVESVALALRERLPVIAIRLVNAAQTDIDFLHSPHDLRLP